MSVFVDQVPKGAPVVVVLVEQEGCPACEEYHPIFEKVAEQYGPAYGIPVMRINAATNDPETQRWMARHSVSGTPTVIVATFSRGPVGKIDGVASAEDTVRLFDRARMFNRPVPSPWNW